MKKALSLVGLVFVTSATFTLAQEHKWTVSAKTDILLGIGLRGERLLSKDRSIFVGGSYSSATSGDVTASAFSLEGGGRMYFSPNHKGAFAEGGLGLTSLTLRDNLGNTASGVIFYPFGLVGYRLGTRVFLDGSIGVAFFIGRVALNNVTIGAFTGFSPVVNLGLGVKF